MRTRVSAFAPLVAIALAACSSDAGLGSPSGPPGIPPVDPATGLRAAEHGPVPPLPEWADNPPSEAKKVLGRAIYFDPRLSGSGTATCGNCHLSVTNFQ